MAPAWQKGEPPLTLGVHNRAMTIGERNDPSDQNVSDEDIAVEHAADRLAERYPRVPREQIDQLVEKHHGRYDGAPVRDFVPVLVEHDVKKELNAQKRAD
jgi:hypothetical protein